MSNILLAGAWADWSVRDVETGYVNALKALGHDVYLYRLSARLNAKADDLERMWRRSGKAGPRPTSADCAYYAAIDVLERAHYIDPDWVLVISGEMFHPQVVTYLRRANFRVGVILTESPYNDKTTKDWLAAYDIAWANERTSVSDLRQALQTTFYLPHAYDPSIHFPADSLPVSVASHDVVFVGTLFKERQDILSAINWDGIDLGLYGHFPYLGSRSHLRKYIKGGVIPNDRAALLYQNAKIGLNLYRRSIGLARQGTFEYCDGDSLNPRALELAATGCFQISDYRPEVEEVFGESVPTFQRPEDLENLIRFYLERPQVRESLSNEARARVQGRTFKANAEAILRDCDRYNEMRKAWQARQDALQREEVLSGRLDSTSA